ncbi:MAG: hypothetical protein AAB656_00240 [Patescibacteria group bacterium]
MRRLQWTLLSVLIFFLVLASVLVYLLFSNQSFLSKTNTATIKIIPYSERQIDVKSNIPGLKIEIVDKDELLKFLNGNSFWMTDKVANFDKPEVRLTANKIIININERVANPFSIQQDAAGNLVIATSLNISDNGDVNINIALGKYLLEQERQNIPKWLKNEFWKAINLAIRGKFSPASGSSLKFDSEYKDEVFALSN